MDNSLKFFGTDGIRGKYGDEIINEDFAYSFGIAWGKYLETKNCDKSLPVFLARDTRHSGRKLLLACQTALKENGFFAHSLDILPTPALAFTVCNEGALGGIMITASHNPHYDNGLKIISNKGGKLGFYDESLIESFIIPSTPDIDYASPQEIHSDRPAYINRYIENLSLHFNPKFLLGLNIVVDLANGATKEITPRALECFGANVISLNRGEGLINDQVGSEYVAGLSKHVVEEKADLGIAHDGDGDRVVFVDKYGNEINGDKILGILAIHAKKQGLLTESKFVATVHSNSGLEYALRDKDICLYRSDVGDRNVFSLMEETNSNWGGESSGHIICSDYMNTGDGLFSALSVLKCVKESQQDLTTLSDEIKLWPSKSSGILIKNKIPIKEFKELHKYLQYIKKELAANARVLIRYSGTEPKLRVLVEALDTNLADKIFEKVQKLVKKHI
jgi:phosphoglucosamine mutase